MSAQHTPRERFERSQSISERMGQIGPQWTDFTVTTHSNWDGIESRTRVRTPKDAELFVDLEIEMYTGETKRAKCCHVRLGEEATLKLYAALVAKFAGGAA